MPTHVVLLRAVNLGSTGKVPMAELRRILAGRGFTDVATYIQSGNVVLTSSGDVPAVAAEVEAVLREEFALERPVVVFAADEYRQAIADNPYPDVEGTPKLLHAVFRAAPIGPEQVDAVAGAVRAAREKTGVPDDATAVGRVLYLHLPDGLGRSELAARLLRPPFTKAPDGGGTARNWATVLKLRAMLDA